MPVEHSAGAVIFRRERKEGKTFYLLLRYPVSVRSTKKEYWGFPKGHVEKGENLEKTARREIKEETGLEGVKFVRGFKEGEKYFFTRKGKKIYKTVIFLLAEARTKNVTISSEHLDYKWLPYKEASAKLTFKNAKEILKKANGFLSGKSI